MLERPRIERPPVVFHPHGLETEQRLPGILPTLRSLPLRPLVRAHARMADRVISQGGELGRLLVERCRTDPERIRILPNAVSEDQLAGAPREAPHAPRRLLFLGRDEPRKGLPLLLGALARLSREADLPEVALDVVGPPPQAGVTRVGTTAVRWHGPVADRARVRRFFDEADWFVLPSLAEGFPTVVLEALSRGLPVLTSRVGAACEPLARGEVGFSFEPGSRAALGTTIEKALAEPREAWRHHSAEALRVVREHFTRRHVLDGLEALLAEAVGSAS